MAAHRKKIYHHISRVQLCSTKQNAIYHYTISVQPNVSLFSRFPWILLLSRIFARMYLNEIKVAPQSSITNLRLSPWPSRKRMEDNFILLCKLWSVGADQNNTRGHPAWGSPRWCKRVITFIVFSTRACFLMWRHELFRAYSIICISLH